MADGFLETPLVMPTPVKKPGEVARGADWYVVEDGPDHVLHFLTGELPERADSVRIDPAETWALQDGRKTLGVVLREHGL